MSRETVETLRDATVAPGIRIVLTRETDRARGARVVLHRAVSVAEDGGRREIAEHENLGFVEGKVRTLEAHLPFVAAAIGGRLRAALDAALAPAGSGA